MQWVRECVLPSVTKYVMKAVGTEWFMPGVTKYVMNAVGKEWVSLVLLSM